MTNKEINAAYIGDIEATRLYLGDNLVWEGTDYSEKPLTFKVISAGTIYWNAQGTAYTTTIGFKKNDGEWINIRANAGAFFVNAGDTVQFRGDNATYSSGTSRYNFFSASTGTIFEVEGNIMSLIDSENFATATTLTSSNTFSHLFYYCTGLTSAENLVLPATTLADYCYTSMFEGCKSLTTAPALPATTLADNCYQNMFVRCTSLTTAPELPATTLASSCYRGMFDTCTSLTTAPELPATTLATSCYRYMFHGCSSLTTAPELPATMLFKECYQTMFQYCTNLNYIKCLATDITAMDCTRSWIQNVSASGTFVKHPDASWTTGNNGIPNGWTVINADN